MKISKDLFLGVILSLMIISSMNAFAISIPPTKAYDGIITSNGTISATSYHGSFKIQCSGCSVTASQELQTIFLSIVGGGISQGTYNETLANNVLVNSGGYKLNFLNGTNNPIRITNSNGGQEVNVTISSLSSSSNVIGFLNPSNKTGTSSLTPIMEGVGFTITPTNTGRLQIIVTGMSSNTLATDGTIIDLRYGTGTSPSNQDPATGTICGSSVKTSIALAGGTVPFSIACQVTGLTLNTSYWIDLSEAVMIGGSASLLNLNINVIEV